MKKFDFRIPLLAMMAIMAACQDRKYIASVEVSPTVSPTVIGSPSVSPTTAPAAANNPTDKWLGQWTGVEGTYLRLSKNGEKYVVVIANLDGPKTYEGVAAGDRIEFKRGGKTESIRAATGKETGMKWLLDEKNCLVVTVGSEGFCRK